MNEINKAAAMYIRYLPGNYKGLKTQLIEITRLAMAEGITITQFYIDEVSLVQSIERPELQQLLKFQTLYVYTKDRFARDAHQANTILTQLASMSVHIHFVAETLPPHSMG
ncbi:MAG TPA: recombinase family protein [Anaerolineales bacterium]|nr:recombinase family protein [Anaerolineales bacterium]